MTEAADPRAGARDAVREHQLEAIAELMRSGFVLVVHESGMVCANLSMAVIKQCQDQGIRCDLVPIEQVNLKTLHLYTALFLVLPTPSASDVDVVEQFEKVYAAYRGFRRHGLASVLTAQQSWWTTGTVHTVLWGRDSGDRNPFPGLEEPCVVRYVTDPKSLGDVFDAYRSASTAVGYDPAAAILENAIACWKHVQAWGVRSLTEVDAIHDRIEVQIEFYNNPAFPKTSRPIKTVKGNRLELVLRDPEMKFKVDYIDKHLQKGPEVRRKAPKAFKEAGAKVVRETLKVIRAQHPHVIRPDDRAKTKDNQKAFKEFYDAVLTLHGLPAEMRDRIPES